MAERIPSCTSACASSSASCIVCGPSSMPGKICRWVSIMVEFSHMRENSSPLADGSLLVLLSCCYCTSLLLALQVCEFLDEQIITLILLYRRGITTFNRLKVPVIHAWG